MPPFIRGVVDWRPRTPFYYGWLILAVSFVAAFSASSVSQVVLGGVQIFITDDTGWSKSSISFAVTLGTWCSGLVAPFAGRITDRHGPRWLMPVALVVVGTALVSLWGVHSIVHFYVAYILSRAVSNPIIIGIVPRTTAVNFFRRRRNIALALTSMARPVSGAINIQLISFIASRQGWRVAYGYLGVMSFLMVIPLAVIMRRRPEDIGMLPDGARPGTVSAQLSAGTGGGGGRGQPDPLSIPEFSWTVSEVVHTRAFWFIVSTAVLGTLASSGVGFSLVPYLYEEAGISRAQAVGVLSFGTVLAVANLGWGYLADLITPRRCLVVIMLVTAMLTLYLVVVGSVLTAFIFALLWGVFSGSVGTLEHMVLAQYYGRGSYGSILGVMSPMQTAALGLGPSLGAVFKDVTGNYSSLFLALFGTYLVAAVLIFLARPPRLPTRATAEVVEDQPQGAATGGS